MSMYHILWQWYVVYLSQLAIREREWNWDCLRPSFKSTREHQSFYLDLIETFLWSEEERIILMVSLYLILKILLN